MTRRATVGVWTKNLALHTAGTGGTAAKDPRETLGAMEGEVVVEGRANLQARATLDQTEVAPLEVAAMVVGAVVGVQEEAGVPKDREAPLAVPAAAITPHLAPRAVQPGARGN